MKLTKTKTNKGMTLIELTVVILVLLSLISVLFIGARAWMRGSDRANAAILIRNAQQGVRSQANIAGMDALQVEQDYEPLDNETLQSTVFGPGQFVETETPGGLPEHPAADGTPTGPVFEAGGTSFEHVPAIGTLYLQSSVETNFYAPRGLQ